MKKKVESKNTFKNQKTKIKEELIQYEELEQYDFIEDDYIEEVSGKYGKLIGLFLINFSRLEHVLNQAIADFIFDRAHEPGYFILGYLSIINKIDYYVKHHIRILEFVSELSKDRIKNLKKKLLEMNEFRNSIAHANWSTLNKKGYVRTKIHVDNNNGLVKFKNIKITPDILKENIVNIEDLIEEIYEIQEVVDNHVD